MESLPVPVQEVSGANQISRNKYKNGPRDVLPLPGRGLKNPRFSTAIAPVNKKTGRPQLALKKSPQTDTGGRRRAGKITPELGKRAYHGFYFSRWFGSETHDGLNESP